MTFASGSSLFVTLSIHCTFLFSSLFTCWGQPTLSTFALDRVSSFFASLSQKAL
jgi:hypothetical protein